MKRIIQISTLAFLLVQAHFSPFVAMQPRQQPVSQVDDEVRMNLVMELRAKIQEAFGCKKVIFPRFVQRMPIDALRTLISFDGEKIDAALKLLCLVHYSQRSQAFAWLQDKFPSQIGLWIDYLKSLEAVRRRLEDPDQEGLRLMIESMPNPVVEDLSCFDDEKFKLVIQLLLRRHPEQRQHLFDELRLMSAEVIRARFFLQDAGSHPARPVETRPVETRSVETSPVQEEQPSPQASLSDEESDLTRVFKASLRSSQEEEDRRIAQAMENSRKTYLEEKFADQENLKKAYQECPLPAAGAFPSVVQEDEDGQAATPPSLVKDLLELHRVTPDRLAVGRILRVGETSARFYRPRTNVVVLEVPVVKQRGATCGSHAHINAEGLVRMGQVDQLFALGEGPVLQTALVNNMKNLVQLRKNVFTYYYNHVTQDRTVLMDLVNYLGSSAMMRFDEMFRYNGNQMTQNVNGIHRTIIVEYGDIRTFAFQGGKNAASSALLQARDRFQRTGNPEVFTVIVPGHWYTVRVEQIEPGVVGIIVADSLSGNALNHPELFDYIGRIFGGN